MSPASKITFCCFLVILLCLRLVRDSSRTSVLANVSTANFRRSLLRQVLTEEHHFVPAFDQGIRYVGRWLHLPNQLRWDTAFPGAYIEFVVRNASIIFVSLHDARSVATKEEGLLQETKLRRINFKPSNDRNYAAPPLTVQVCDGNILMYSSSEQSLLSIHVNVSTHDKGCLLRVSHAGGTSGGDVLQFEGLWLPNGAWLLPRLQPHEDTASIVQATRDLKQTSESSRQILEVFTDSATCASDHSSQFIVEWLSQLTVTFDIDYVQIPTYGHCLSEACLRTKPDGVSIQDIFFRSGPPKSTLFATPWDFHNYIPDVLILNLGIMDQQFLQSSTAHSENHVYFDDTRESLEGLTNSIVETYVDLIRRIRQTAYPLHPSALEKIDGDGYIYSSAPSTLPIFVVRPFDDSLEQVTLTVVERLQKDGDKAVFWIDTSGWVSEADYGTGGEDRNARCLTAAGHAKVASFMRAHLCHYLSPNSQECPFLRRDNYLGSVYVPIDAELDKIIEESKVQKLTELFWQYA